MTMDNNNNNNNRKNQTHKSLVPHTTNLPLSLFPLAGLSRPSCRFGPPGLPIPNDVVFQPRMAIDDDASPRPPTPPDDAVPVEDSDESESESEAESETQSLDRVRLADSPILLLVYFHKAFRAEIADLRRAVSHASERGHHAPGFVLGLLRRFEFLKLACKYHCAAEDEVVFMALDVHVKNVTPTYSLEHKSIDDLFDSIFFRLNAMLEEESDAVTINAPTKPFQELVLCLGTIQTLLSKHMLKEEKQIFPKLLEHISVKEQASLVWQFISSVPIVLLEDMFPWMLSFLSPQEQEEVKICLREIVPEEKSLQEVVLSWLGRTNSQPSSIGNIEGVSDMKALLKSRRYFGQSSVLSSLSSSSSSSSHDLVDCLGHNNPLDGLKLWHGAIKKDLIAVLGDLYKAKSSCDFSNLDDIVIQLKFLADIITFYSNALEKLFSPVLNQLVHGYMSPSTGGFPSESHIEGLQMLLYHSAQNDTLPKFVNKLCRELESFVGEITKQFSFHEKEVFPVIGKHCNYSMQQRILYVSVHAMPLGLLKCVITWFSSQLSNEECKPILCRTKPEDPLLNEPFALLLQEWFRANCCGKFSAEKLGTNLQQMFRSRRSFLSDQINDASASKKSKGSSTGFGQASRKHEAYSYSSVINLHVYFPEAMKSYIVGGDDCPGSSSLRDPKPMDLIFYFHKALKADLEFLVSGSLRLAENRRFLGEFRKRFNLIKFLYQIHSDAEDEVAFPALEAKGKVANISHSYTMDHKLESEHFGRVSQILDKLSGQTESPTRHYRLCRRLYDTCESMHRLLVDHIQREEIELWPLFRDCFSIGEQEWVVGSFLGRTNAEVLQDMIPWLMGSLTRDEQHTMMMLWRQVTRHTMFDEWLREWWEGYYAAAVEEEGPASSVADEDFNDNDPLEVVFEYLASRGGGEEREGEEIGGCVVANDVRIVDCELEIFRYKNLGYRESCMKDEKKRVPEVQNIMCRVKPGVFFENARKSKHYDVLKKMSQEDLETAIRRVSRDSSLDSQKKSYIIQNLLVSRWIVRHHSHPVLSNIEQEFPGREPSYRDHLNLSFGCKHFKRNCKLVAPCCNQLYTCLKCHDETADHVIDGKRVSEMMCMKCLKIQPVGPTCTTPSCNRFSMARYYCRICKIFDDDRMIYHCPYCNLCRQGKGLGIDYFHCMNCNACMSRLLFVHICREKCIMDNCPICHEDMFTSTLPVKQLQCGHLMHSKCFEAYTHSNYTCPICGKSLGDMRVYFNMLDALLAEERIPDEYAGQTQAILCNDCVEKGEARFHWLYHKCSFCGSYNTRVL